MKLRQFRQDAAWAVLILGVAGALVMQAQWTLASLSWQGRLEEHLDQLRAARRQVQYQGIRTVNLEQAYHLFQQPGTLILDARDPEEYAELHVEGAVNLTLKKLEAEGPRALPEGNPDRPILVYCGLKECDAALALAERLQKMGFTQVVVFLGGFRAWDEAGYPVDTKQ